MNVAELIDCLNQFPPSLTIVVKRQGVEVGQSTVCELTCRLMTFAPDELATFSGKTSCIMRERQLPGRGHVLEIDGR